MKWYVEVVQMSEDEDGEDVGVVKRLKYSSEKKAEHAENAVMRNLNHDLYYTRIVSEK